jgi:hypothetical protein
MKMLEIKTVDDLVRLIQVCVWAFVVVVLMMVFGGIVSSMLYSVIFVSQPIKSMAPIDQAFTKMLNDIVLIMASSITTIVSMFAVNKGSQALANRIAPTLGIPPNNPTQTYPPYGGGYPCPPTPTSYASSPVIAGQPFGSMPVWVNPALDESWTPGPPPDTAADHIHPEREDIAMERALARHES